MGYLPDTIKPDKETDRQVHSCVTYHTLCILLGLDSLTFGLRDRCSVKALSSLVLRIISYTAFNFIPSTLGKTLKKKYLITPIFFLNFITLYIISYKCDIFISYPHNKMHYCQTQNYKPYKYKITQSNNMIGSDYEK